MAILSPALLEKNMDNLSVSIAINANHWSCTYKNNSNTKDRILYLAGNCSMVTRLEIDSTEFKYGDLEELIDEINDFFAVRGVSYRIGNKFPEMVKV